tara:strand:+ start:18287 stop:18640 length:354 start_codon:yes stop_codon:yes gene_type:complete
MKIIRFIDLVDQTVDEEGNVHEELRYSNFTLPTIIDPFKIDTICPLFTADGKLFKNVSVIKYDMDMMKVLGSPDYLWDLKNDKRAPFEGFYGKQKQKSTKGGTKTKSSPERGTKGSS